MMIWKKQQFIKDFNFFIKQCYHIVWNAEKIGKIKTQKLQRQKRKLILLSKCIGCDSKNSRFIKEQEAGELLSTTKEKIFETDSSFHVK